ncbi:MAG: hypothetical protein IPM77_00485 [Crocinitomicaceae bacterium]|nr:hypothetical protein [Crocinitomicaceae bacterium]
MLTVIGFGQEKFLSIKGLVVDETSKSPVTGYTIKVVQDRLDSTLSIFSKAEFQAWAPANRRTTLYFSKEGYVTKSIYIDASYIPSIAFKEKQMIEVEIPMTELAKTGKRKFDKPIMTAQYDAQSNSFSVTQADQEIISKVSEDYIPPFPAPVDTYKGVQPSANDLKLTLEYNKEKAKSNSDYYRILQGVLFADMNYCFFNERTNDANAILAKLAEMDPEEWGSMKPMDSPEYGKIIMRTVNREQCSDTLFALGAFVESSRLIFENFTSDTKVMVHLKKLRDVLKVYNPASISSTQKVLVESLKLFIPLIDELEKTYTESLKIRADFDLSIDDVFAQLKNRNQAIYESIIQ